MSSKPFELKLEGCGALQSAELQWGLDSAARLLVRTSISSKQRMELGLGNLPKTAGFQMRGEGAFSGLTAYRAISRSPWVGARVSRFLGSAQSNL